jgi:hypothetical protein
VVRTISVFQSEQDRDGMFDAGMAEGMSDAYDRLDDLLTTMRS